MSWNVHGLTSKLNNPEFISYCKCFDIFACAEIYNINKDVLNKKFPEYDIYLSKRKKSSGGGIAVFVAKTFAHLITKIETSLEECIFLLVNEQCLQTDMKVVMCFPYVPHESSPVFKNCSVKGIERLISTFNEISENLGDVEWIISGDMNARTGSLKDVYVENEVGNYLADLDFDNTISEINSCRNSRDNSFVNNYGKQLIKFCLENNLYILNGRAKGDEIGNVTCIANKGKTVVDYVIVTKNIFDRVSCFNVTPRPESDHFPLSLTLNLDHCPFSENNSPERVKTFPVIKLDWNEDKQSMYTECLNINLNNSFDEFYNFISNNDIDAANDLILDCIKHSASSMQRVIKNPQTNYKEYNEQPRWWDKDCDQLKRLKYIHLHEFHKTNKTDDLELFLKYKKLFKAECFKKKKLFDDQNVENLNECLRINNTKSFWQTMNKMLVCPYKPKPTNVSPRKFFAHFKEILNPNTHISDDTDTVVNEIIEDAESDDDYNKQITITEVENALKDLKYGKAGGCDGVGPEFFCNFTPTLVIFLCTLFNSILDTGVYPKQWCQSLIFPLHKQGDTNNPNNYRGISLLNIISKLFSSILNKRLSLWAEKNGLIPQCQAGFRKNYSTIDHIFTLQSIVKKYLSKKCGRFYVLFVDFSKAFDCIPRILLWDVLKKKGLKGKMSNIIKSMYEEVKSAVRLNKYEMTEYFECVSGVKQGCVLSPILFSLYVSELELMLKESKTNGTELLSNNELAYSLMYADDVCLMSDTVIDMQRKIRCLENFCSLFGLSVNLKKTKMIVFRKGGIIKRSEKWRFRNENITVTSYYSYLGMIFSSRLLWTTCIENLCSKASKLISRTRSLCKRYDNIDPRILFKIFDIKIKPLILYGSEIWGVGKCEKVEQMHVKFCKAVLNVGKTTHNNLTLSECGRHHLFVNYNTRAIKYWCRLLYMNETMYAKKCYLQSFNLDKLGKQNWASDIRKLLCSLGFAYAWFYQAVGNKNMFFSQVKQRLIDISIQELRSSITNFRPDYYDFHPEFSPAPYLKSVISYRSRRYIALLRTFSLPIKNNLLRMNLVNNNLCPFCCQTFVENEFHLLYRCSQYNDLRQSILESIIYVHIDENKMSKYNCLLSCAITPNTMKVIHFVNSTMKRFKKL